MQTKAYVPLEVIRIPTPIGYAEMYARQRQRHEAIAQGNAPEALYLLEHFPAITLGRNAHAQNLRTPAAALEKAGITLIETDRGGDITYHGPGQLVAYPLVNLARWNKSVHAYLRALEQTLIGLLATYGLHGERNPGLTGVWVNGAKTAAIGIGIRRWITYHGIALNIAPDMRHFHHIIPCGIPGKPVTSLELLLDQAPPMTEVMDRFEEQFRLNFPPAA